MGAAFAPLGLKDMPHIKPLQVSASVQGTAEVLSLKDIAVSIGQSNGLLMELNGEIGRLSLTGDRAISDVRLAALVRAKSTAALSTVLGVSLPDLGPLQATAQLSDRRGIIGASDVNVRIGDARKPALKVTGSVASVLKDDDVAVDGIALALEVRDLRLKSFSDLIGQPLPDLGPMNGSFRITGSPVQLAISQAKLSTMSPQGLALTATGKIDRIRPQGKKPFEGVELSFMAQAPGLRALPGLEDLDFPDLGSLQMKASVNDRSGNLDVEAFDIRSSSGKAALFRLQGKMLQITDFRHMALQAAFETTSQPWIATYMQQPEVENLPLSGAIKLRGAVDGVRIDEVLLGTADKKSLVLKAEGKITRLSASPEIDLQLTASVPDPGVIRTMMGVSLPLRRPLFVNGRLSGNAREVGFKGETRIGKTAFTAAVRGAFAGQRPRIDANFTAMIVDLEDMGIYPEAPVDDAAQSADSETSDKGRLFDDRPLSFEALRAIDLYLALDADKLVGRNVTIEKLDLNLQLENGRLRIYPVSLTYSAGSTSSEFVIDASGPIPKFILYISAEDVDAEDMLAYAHEPIIISGSLTLFVDLHSSGSSPREIASNLKGEISMVLENGRIRRIINFLSLDAFDALLTTASRSRFTDLNCLINRIQFEDGVGDIEIFLMDSPRIRVRAAGNVNLAEETIDVVLNPEAKRTLFRRRSPVRIRGSLTRPSVRVIPRLEAAMLYADIFMPYVTIPARALGFVWSLIRGDRPPTPCVIEDR
jgi:hypothetical protein